jgi:GNAT superfamily N-acetyltransferase
MLKTSYEIVQTEKKYLDDLIELFIGNYNVTREKNPLLPIKYGTYEGIKASISWMLNNCDGVVALKDGKVVGYMSALILNQFKSSNRGAYTPEFAHSSTEVDKVRIYNMMRTELWKMLSSIECAVHSITLLDDDTLKTDFFMASYGLLVMDAMNTVDQLIATTADHLSDKYSARIAKADEIETIKPLVLSYRDYMSGPPIFNNLGAEDIDVMLERWFMEDKRSVWVVESQTGSHPEIIGFANLITDPDNASYVVRDKSVLGISGTFILSEHRNKGAGSVLYNTASNWAKQNGYDKISVDFESANPLALKFWLNHFEPVTYSLIRHIDDRLIGKL